MEDKEFKLGPIQKKWLWTLRRYPKRQRKDVLGLNTKKKKSMCCLGQLLVCVTGITGEVRDYPDHPKDRDLYTEGVLEFSYEKLGLNSPLGSSRDKSTSLAGMNDGGHTWPEIADVVEANPTYFFNKSY